jgi:uncharacterized protein with HEPN domain
MCVKQFSKKFGMPRDDAARVRDIIDACDRIMSATGGLDRASFAERDVVLRAVLYDFAVIGEAAKGVSPAMRAARCNPLVRHGGHA